MATKRKRNGAWEYVVKRAKVLPRPISLTFRDEGEGDAYVRRLEALLDRGIVPDEYKQAKPEQHPRLRAAIIDYKERHAVSAADLDYLGVLLDRLPPKLELRMLTYEWAGGWVTAMKRVDNLAPSTIRHHVGALARCLDEVVRRGGLVINPLRQLPRGYATYTTEDGIAVAQAGDGSVAKADEERDRRLLPGEEVRIRAVLAGEKPAGRQRAFELHEAGALRLFFELALETAMRMSEMYTLDAAQVDFRKHTIFLDRTKNGSKRQVPMSSVAQAAMMAFLERQRSGQIFPWWRASRDVKEMKRCTSQLSRQFGRVFEAADCPGLRFHDLRHEAISRIYERTSLTDLQIAKITGHRDIRQLARYANLRGSELAGRLW